MSISTLMPVSYTHLTGKTAAFALPLLEQIDVKITKPQALILTPTRELAIQVAEALQSYARHLPGFHVLPIYGGQSYTIQLKQLARGAHVIVGTPGRVMDHLERKTLSLDNLKTLVLDEADEMLRMGFIDDVEWILERTPAKHQTALFSATMPDPIRRVAQKYLVEPREVKIKSACPTNIRGASCSSCALLMNSDCRACCARRMPTACSTGPSKPRSPKSATAKRSACSPIRRWPSVTSPVSYTHLSYSLFLPNDTMT